MTNSRTAKARRVSSKKSQAVNRNNTAAINDTETNTDQTGQIIAMPATAKLAKNTKLETSEMTLTPLPGNRPIDSSNIHVVSTISVMGERPIVASNNKIWNTITMSGERPIYSSNLVISSTAMIMGNRPVASNFFEGEGNLMGYLD
ncbi:MAG: hypothetical protein WBG73_19775 [Coleofasciculaceae cyanobacterium]